MCEGQPILFTRPELAPLALDRSDCGASEIGAAPREVYAVFDITAAVYAVQTDEVEGTDLVDILNTILDFVRCLNIRVPDEYRSAMVSLADHMTFSSDIRAFFHATGVVRETVIDAIYWSLGMIIYNVKIMSE